MTLEGQRLVTLAVGLVLVGVASCVPEAGGSTKPAVQNTDPGPTLGPGPGGAAPDLCAYATPGDGPYCARSLLMGSADNLLLVCARGATVSQTTCSGRCAQGADNMPGGDDACVDAEPVIEQQPPAQSGATDGDPCSAASRGDGSYCGQSLDPALGGAELYQCIGRQTASIIVCPDGCQVMPAGTSDVCVGAASAAPRASAPSTPASTDPCSAATLGDGGYCAQSLDASSTAAKLYTCVGGQTASVIPCPEGCQVMPPGINDVCADGSTSSGSPPIEPGGPTSTGSCSATQAGACGGDSEWCTNDGQCQSCASGWFNCNGTYGCECRYGCYGSGCLQCSPDVASSCSGSSSWCYQGQCRLCTQGFFNCNGVSGCECDSQGCDGTKCKGACTGGEC